LTSTSRGSGEIASLDPNLRWLCCDAPLLRPLFLSSWTHRLITAKDHASVQINIGNVDPHTGRYTGDFKTFAISGYIRDKARRVGCWKFSIGALPALPAALLSLQSESDMALSTLIAEAEPAAVSRRH
jgi:hypothetical protein